ncbi:hypothetical protein [Kingella potus]|nr:hypothetical protein [Kingella potus]
MRCLGNTPYFDGSGYPQSAVPNARIFANSRRVCRYSDARVPDE